MSTSIKLHYYYRIFKQNLFTYTMGILGLSVGIAMSVLIYHWISNELSHDKFNSDYNNTYRLIISGVVNGVYEKGTGLEIPLYKECLNRFLEIEQGTILHPDFADNVGIVSEGERFFESDVAVVDTNFFRFFDYNIVRGSGITAINAPDKVVISERLANRLFNTNDILGKIIHVFGEDFQVGAVMENMPVNSHLNANLLVPVWGVPWMQEPGRGFNLYFKLSEHTDRARLAGQIAQLKTAFYPEDYDVTYIFQPLKDIRFSTDIQFDFVKGKVGKDTIMTVALLMLIILVLACINFTNLFLSSLYVRAWSAGIKKVNGANRKTIVADLVGETFTYVFVATVIGVLLASSLVPYFNAIAGSDVALSFVAPKLYLFLILLIVFVTLITSLHPAIKITKVDPVVALKGKGGVPGTSRVQKILVITQFAASIVILICVGVIQKQLNYSLNIDLGMYTSNIIHFNPYGEFAESYDAVRDELIKHPAIVDVTAKLHTPLWVGDLYTIHPWGEEKASMVEYCYVKDNYFDFMGMDILQGEGLNMFHDSIDVALINMKLLKQLGSGQVVGKSLQGYRHTMEVKGVVGNVRKSAYRFIEPQVYQKIGRITSASQMLVQTTNNKEAALGYVQQLWEEKVPHQPFEYS